MDEIFMFDNELRRYKIRKRWIMVIHALVNSFNTTSV